MKKKIFITIITVLLCIVVSGCSTGSIKLNETTDIKDNKIKLTVLGSEKVKIDEGELSVANGDYIKVKMSIENYGSETYTWTLLNFSLGEEMPSLTTAGQDDYIASDVNSGQTITGYMYFPVTESDKLIYYSKVIGNDSNSTYEFNI